MQNSGPYGPLHPSFVSRRFPLSPPVFPLFPPFSPCFVCSSQRVQCSGIQGGGGMRSPGLAKNAEKCGKNAENAAKNAIENAVWLEWCLPLKTPMFRLVLHNWALKAWTV